MNAGLDEPWPAEERLLVASPNVRTYDEAPAMSLEEVTAKLCYAIENKTHDLIICNFANADMVGHTGDYNAAVKAIESIDKSLAQVVVSLSKVKGEALVTADHGNAEQMADPITGQPHTAHTCEPVPLIYIGPGQGQWRNIEDARLSDIAPTILKLMNIQQPPEMTGRCLLDVCYN
jgi:2,3-bisphosphoglycerate-independent phosphoglycerate mutase